MSSFSHYIHSFSLLSFPFLPHDLISSRIFSLRPYFTSQIHSITTIPLHHLIPKSFPPFLPTSHSHSIPAFIQSSYLPSFPLNPPFLPHFALLACLPPCDSSLFLLQNLTNVYSQDSLNVINYVLNSDICHNKNYFKLITRKMLCLSHLDKKREAQNGLY